MDTDHFWTLIDSARQLAEEDVDRYGPMLEQALSPLTAEQLIAFERLFNSFIDDAWRWDLWGAAYIVNGGCSDDGFLYFRGWLVMQGQQVYTDSLANPDKLADICVNAGDAYECEEVLYVARSLYLAMAGHEMPLHGTGGALTPEPQGQQWDEDDLATLFPRLAELHL